jgi:hypothetical protein
LSIRKKLRSNKGRHREKNSWLIILGNGRKSIRSFKIGEDMVSGIIFLGVIVFMTIIVCLSDMDDGWEG